MPDLVLADDNLTTQRVFELSFGDEAVHVRSFSRGADALAHLQENSADIAFLNVSLRDIDGYSLCRKIKTNRTTSSTPVVLLVGAFQVFDEQRARRAGCRAHLAKPFETSQLLSLVKVILEEPRTEPEAADLLPEGYLFHIPFQENSAEIVFQLGRNERRPSFHVLEREVALPASPSLVPATNADGGASAGRQIGSVEELQAIVDPAAHSDPDDFRRLVEKLAERLPQELRRLLPEIVRDISAREE